LFGEGGEPEIRVRIDPGFRMEIADALGSRIGISSADANQRGEAGFIRLDKPAKDGVFRAFHGFLNLASSFHCTNQSEPQSRGCPA
jgi:hypothetical protein